MIKCTPIVKKTPEGGYQESVLVQKTSDGEYQFSVGPDEDNHMLVMRVAHSGLVIDVIDSDGGIVRSAYRSWPDLDDMTLPPR